MSKPLHVRMGPHPDETWNDFMDRLQKEGYRPRTRDECGEESSHATLVVMPCSCRGWERVDEIMTEEDIQIHDLPCRRCRCGHSSQHTPGCFKDEDSQVILV